MEEYAQTVPTPPTSEEDQQVPPSIPMTTEYILPDVDPSLSMKTEVEVKIEPNQGVSGRYECGECQKSFTTAGSRKFHIRTLHGGASYTCQTCANVFNRKDNLRHNIKSLQQDEKQ